MRARPAAAHGPGSVRRPHAPPASSCPPHDAAPVPSFQDSAAMSDQNTTDYSKTLNLPDTPFPMRGNLP